MPQIAKIEVKDNELWCLIPKHAIQTKDWLPVSSITLWTPDEIKAHDRDVITAFLLSLRDTYLGKTD